MKKIGILQPNYLPWKGVFDLINRCDIFVFLDDVQYTKRDWRNRNLIKTSEGLKWITVPVISNSREFKINEIEINNQKNWKKKHLNSFYVNYHKSKYFEKYYWLLEQIYNEEWKSLSELDIQTTIAISKQLGIQTEFFNSSSLNIKAEKNERIIEIIEYFHAEHYITGPAASDYLIPEEFNKRKIKLEYMNYNYPEYGQLYGKFYHNVSIMDVIFNCGEESRKYITNINEVQ